MHVGRRTTEARCLALGPGHLHLPQTDPSRGPALLTSDRELGEGMLGEGMPGILTVPWPSLQACHVGGVPDGWPAGPWQGSWAIPGPQVGVNPGLHHSLGPGLPSVDGNVAPVLPKRQAPAL